MKIIIAGTRTITSYKTVLDAIRESQFIITELVTGGYKGTEELAKRYAHIHHIPIKTFPINFKNEGWFYSEKDDNTLKKIFEEFK